MGIYGLTSYVEDNKELFFEDYKLHDCVLLLDGNSVAAQIYSYSKSNYAFGGDYDKYAYYINEFIRLLQKCNVVPIFIFDGAYEERKLKTVIERIKVNVRICGQYENKYKESKCYPLLLKDVFKTVLNRHNLTIIQSDFEADQEIIIISKLFHWPIVSYDSDFFLADVDYIPFNTIQLTALKLRDVKKEKKYYIPCEIYRVDNLLNNFGGLKNKAFLPLLSTLLGNDYIPGNTFQGFLSLMQNSSLIKRLEKIIKWLRNLQSVEDGIKQMISVVDERRRKRIRNVLITLVDDYKKNYSSLIVHIPKHLLLNVKENTYLCSIPCNTRHITNSSEQCASTNNNNNSTNKTHNRYEGKIYYSSENKAHNSNVKETVNDISNLCKSTSKMLINTDDGVSNTLNSSEHEDSDVTEEDEYNEDDVIVLSDCEIDNCNFENKSDSDTETADEVLDDGRTAVFGNYSFNKGYKHDIYSAIIPEWLRINLNKGIVSPSVMNILCSRRIFIHSQPEDYSASPSHEIALPIMQVVIGLLLKPNKEEKNEVLKLPQYVKCHARVKSSCAGTFDISPIYSTMTIPRLPSLVSVPQECFKLRATILLDTLGIDEDVDLTEFPADWSLFIVALIFWAKHCKYPEINKFHIRAIIICITYLYVIDEKVGYIRLRKTLVKLYDELNKQQIDTDKSSGNNNSTNNIDSKPMLLSDIVNSVSKLECLHVANSLLNFHKVDDGLLQNRKSFNIKLVHALAQFQNCLQYITMLNTVLNLPFVSCEPSKFLSCTLLYNVYNDLIVRNSVDEYVTRTLLSNAPTIIVLYRKLTSKLDGILSFDKCNHTVGKSKDKSKKRKKRKCVFKSNNAVDRSVKNHEENESDDDDNDNGSYFDPNNKYSVLVDIMA